MIMGIIQPIAAPILRWRPCRVVGIPVARANFAFAEEIPSARFKENDMPNFLPIIASSYFFLRIYVLLPFELM